jgi:hypothetical protein
VIESATCTVAATTDESAFQDVFVKSILQQFVLFSVDVFILLCFMWLLIKSPWRVLRTLTVVFENEKHRNIRLLRELQVRLRTWMNSSYEDEEVKLHDFVSSRLLQTQPMPISRRNSEGMTFDKKFLKILSKASKFSIDAESGSNELFQNMNLAMELMTQRFAAGIQTTMANPCLDIVGDPRLLVAKDSQEEAALSCFLNNDSAPSSIEQFYATESTYSTQPPRSSQISFFDHTESIRALQSGGELLDLVETLRVDNPGDAARNGVRFGDILTNVNGTRFLECSNAVISHLRHLKLAAKQTQLNLSFARSGMRVFPTSVRFDIIDGILTLRVKLPLPAQRIEFRNKFSLMLFHIGNTDFESISKIPPLNVHTAHSSMSLPEPQFEATVVAPAQSQNPNEIPSQGEQSPPLPSASEPLPQPESQTENVPSNSTEATVATEDMSIPTVSDAAQVIDHVSANFADSQEAPIHQNTLPEATSTSNGHLVEVSDADDNNRSVNAQENEIDQNQSTTTQSVRPVQPMPQPESEPVGAESQQTDNITESQISPSSTLLDENAAIRVMQESSVEPLSDDVQPTLESLELDTKWDETFGKEVWGEPQSSQPAATSVNQIGNSDGHSLQAADDSSEESDEWVANFAQSEFYPLPPPPHFHSVSNEKCTMRASF